MKRSLPFSICLLFTTLLCFGQETPPNILLIITDQHSGTVMTQRGYPYIQTPGIDKIAGEGVTFTRGYVTYPVCTNSRKSLMTGVMPSKLDNVTDFPAIGKKLADAGYETAYYGKWHVGTTSISGEADWHGFEDYQGTSDDTNISQLSRNFLKKTHTKPFFMVNSFMNPHDACELARNLSGDNDSYNDGDVGALTVDLSLCPPLPSNFAIPENEPEGYSARRNQDPDDDYYSTNPYKLWTETEWRRYIYGYDRFLEKVDAHIEDVYDELDAQGLLENTIIIYTSEHGDGHASHQWTQKKTFYEETINVPFVVSWKGETKAGVIDRETLVSNGLDIYPTMLKLAGIAVPESLLGADLSANFLQDPGEEIPVTRPYVVSELDQRVYKSNTPGTYNGRMVVTKDFKYVLFDRGANNEQLFDVVNDPGELNPITYDPAFHDQLLACREMLREWVLNTNDNFEVDASIYKQKVYTKRLNNGEPIIYEDMFTSLGASEYERSNINGPSVIRVPDWIAPENRANPEAQYYCYFAHHSDQYIRMAWASEIEGPWHLYNVGSSIAVGNRGVLDNNNSDILLANGLVIENNHLASPNVHVDHENNRIIMYFHSGSSTFVNGEEVNKQLSWVSTSPYGLDFYDGIEPVFFGGSYFSVFEYGGERYALDNGASLYRALDYNAPWTPPANHDFTDGLWETTSNNPFQDAITENLGLEFAELRVRHTNVRVVGDILEVYYSRRGDLLENIQMSTIDLSASDWTNWEISWPPQQVLQTAPGWEGGDLTPQNSESGSAPEDVNQLRDPYVFTDEDGSRYLFYTGRGEDAIGLASLNDAHNDVLKLSLTGDAFVKAGSFADTNYGTSTELIVSQGVDTDFQKTYLNFDLSEVEDVDKAIVRLYTNSTSSAPVTVYETGNEWTETGITWNNAPAIGTAIATTQIEATEKYNEWDITSFVKNNLGESISIVFYDESVSNNPITFNSKEGVHAPELLLVSSSVYSLPPAKPLDLTAVTISATEINISWSDDAFNEDGFRIERKEENGIYQEIGSVGLNTSAYNDVGLSPETTYIYRVMAFNADGNSNYSDESSTTTFNADFETFTYNSNEDSYVRGGDDADNNFGTETDLVVKIGDKADFFRKTLVKFNLSNEEDLENKIIGRAVVRLYTNKVSDECTLTVSEIGNNWTESTVTWTNAPATGSAIKTITVSNNKVYYEWDVTEYVEDRLANDKIISFTIEDLEAESETVEFNSKEAGSNIPELVINTVGDVDEPLSVSGLGAEKKQIKVYPNPVTDVLNMLDISGKKNKLTIFDLTGKALYNDSDPKNSNQINVNWLSNGIYLLKVETDAGFHLLKFLKE